MRQEGIGEWGVWCGGVRGIDKDYLLEYKGFRWF